MIGALWRIIQFVAFAALAALVAGFALYVKAGLDHGPDASVRGDGIVALTGGDSRVQTAVNLLTEDRAERLLISGANPIATLADIRDAAGAEAGLFDCCVDIGVDAADTIGNAAETADWTARNGYARVIVVTSDFHMPRALLELRAAMPDTDFLPYAVKTPAPWSEHRAARRWLQEYLKCVAVYARLARQRFTAA